MELRKRSRGSATYQIRKAAERGLAKIPAAFEENNNEHFLDRCSIRTSIGLYKTIEPFANHLKLSQHAFETSNSIVKTLEDVQKALTALHNCSVQLRNQVGHIWELVGRRKYWYRGGNIFDIDPKILEAMFTDSPTIDLDDFGKYLYETIDAHGIIDTEIDVEWSYMERRDVKCKAFMFDHCEEFIVDALEQLWAEDGKPSRLRAFQIAVLLDVKLFAHRLDERNRRERKYKLLQDKVRSILDAATHIDTLARQRVRPISNTTYLNQAMAARTWQQAFEEAGECTHRRALRFGEPGWEEEQQFSQLRHGQDKCMKRSNLSKLERHYQAAWSEIRFGVMSTLGRYFSAELAEMIFEQTLDVEGIPRDPRLFEKIEHEDGKGGCPWMPRWDKQPRIEYDCGQTESDASSDSD